MNHIGRSGINQVCLVPTGITAAYAHNNADIIPSLSDEWNANNSDNG